MEWMQSTDGFICGGGSKVEIRVFAGGGLLGYRADVSCGVASEMMLPQSRAELSIVVGFRICWLKFG